MRSISRKIRLSGIGLRSIAFSVFLTGLVNILSAIVPAVPASLRLLEEALPLEIVNGSRILSVLSGFALIVLSLNIRRRKHAAWVLVLMALAMSLAAHLLKGLDYEEASLTVILFVALLALRTHFYAGSDRPSVRRGVFVLAGALVFVLLYGTAGFFILDRHFHERFSLADSLAKTLAMFVEFTDSGAIAATRYGRYFVDSIYIVAAASMAYALFTLLRPVLHRRTANRGELELARNAVSAHGRTSIAHLTLTDEKLHFFTKAGTAVSYVVKGRCALALGDPLGPEADIRTAIIEFRRFCEKNDWFPVFYQTLPDYLELYRAEDFESVKIGEEAIVRLDAFSLEGKTAQNLRTQMNRMKREEMRCEIYTPPIPHGILLDLKIVSDEWLGAGKGLEIGFATGRFSDDWVKTSYVAAAIDRKGIIQGFLNLIPMPGRNGITIDLMRKRIGAVQGTMDFLFVNAIQWAKDRGYQVFSLALSPLAGTGTGENAQAAERVLGALYERMNGMYNFKGLNQFKDKFHPGWEPRYLVLPGLRDLPAAGIALLRAQAGEGFFFRRMKDRITVRTR